MRKSEVKSKSVRRPLTDVVNNIGRGRSAGPMTTAAKKFSEKDKPRAEEEEEEEEILLIQSDLSHTLRKFDELIAKASKLKLPSKPGIELESFAHDLSKMRSSLKSWVPRLKALSSSSLECENQSGKPSLSQAVSAVNEFETEAPKSPEKADLDFLISPSPLVSWRANCTIERGRQMFLLTPLPISKTLSSKHPHPPKDMFGKTASDALKKFLPFSSTSINTTYDLLKDIEIKPASGKPSHLVTTETTSSECCAVSPVMFSRSNRSMVETTPCLKRSPPKTCVLLESISESSHAGKVGIRKSTPFPVGIKKCSDLHISESSSSGSETSEGLALKYPELLGIQGAYKSGAIKKQIEASPDWFRSPPKTCVLIEPFDEKPLDNDNIAASNCHLSMPVTGNVLKAQTNVPAPEVDSQDTFQQVNKNLFQEPAGGNLGLVENTPIWKESQSTNRRGKHPGENTLKKELWTKFEAASTNGLRLSVSVLQEHSQKGFLDRLDEAEDI